MKNRNRRGAVAIEFAFVFPILFLFLVASYELSRANIIMHTCESAAYEGARTGIVPGANSAKTEAAARNVLDTLKIKNAQITTDPVVIVDDTESVAVTIEVNFAENSILIPNFVGGNIRRTCRMNREEL